MNGKLIVTTTINPPTPAIRRYDAMPDWDLLVIGDRSTPEYKLERGYFMSWAEQQSLYPDLCEHIGPDSVARGRMIAFIHAYKMGAEIVASIDDDNIPSALWGRDVYVGRKTRCREYMCGQVCMDPLSISIAAWGHRHRGFPLEINQNGIPPSDLSEITPLVQEDLWTGDGDVNAAQRILHHSPNFPQLHVSRLPFFSRQFSPVNTQNTFFHRSALKDFYANIPFIGRADDIWAGYIFEALHPGTVVYGDQTVHCEQDRSYASIIQDLKDELFMYEFTLPFLYALRDIGVEKAIETFLPTESVRAIDLYRNYFE